MTTKERTAEHSQDQEPIIVTGIVLSPPDDYADSLPTDTEGLLTELEYIRENQTRNMRLSEVSRETLDLIFEHLDPEQIAEHEILVESAEQTPLFDDLEPAPSTAWTDIQSHTETEALSAVGMTVYDVILTEPDDADLSYCRCDYMEDECEVCISLILYASFTLAPHSPSVSDRIAHELDFDLSTLEGTAEVDQLLTEIGLRW